MKNKRKTVVLITELFLGYGGVETRSRQYARFWTSKGWNAYIASAFQSVNGAGFLRGLGRAAWWNTLVLCLWRFLYNVRVVEWQSGGESRVRFYPAILRWVGIRTGVVLHGKVSARSGKIIQKTDYALCVSPVQKERFPFLSSCTCIPNAVSSVRLYWQYAGQKKALLVSRLDKDKAVSVYAFIRFCLKTNTSFDVVGDGDIRMRVQDFARRLCTTSGLAEPIFWGRRPTEDFLYENAARYLWVGGIGLVALEAASAGYPVLLCPVAGLGRCFFLKAENFQALAHYNFSPHTVEEVLAFSKNGALSRAEAQTLKEGKVETFSLPSDCLHSCTLGVVQKKYWHAVWRFKSE